MKIEKKLYHILSLTLMTPVKFSSRFAPMHLTMKLSFSRYFDLSESFLFM
jgi:hypothetical protein